ncbi:MAG: phytoene desaturase family protein [Gemmobacter sp.]
MPMPSFDAIVIGAGPNGLAAAHALRGQGRDVLLLDDAPVPGGGASGRGAFAPGFPAPPLAHLAFQLDPRVAAGMRLAEHGLDWITTDLATTALSDTGAHLVLSGPAGAMVEGVSPEDRAAWAALRARLMRFAQVLGPFRRMPPPRLARRAGNDWGRLLRAAAKVRMIGTAEFRELLRMLLTNVHDTLNDELTDPRLKGVLAFDATLGTWLAPRSPNSLILWLDRLAGQAGGVQGALGLPKGGVGAIAAAMARSAQAAGVVVRADARAARVLVEGDRARGVALASGEEIAAGLVVSAISPKDTLLSLVGPRHLDAGMTARMAHQKARGAAAKLHLALTGLPDFRGADPATRLVIAPSEEDVEHAFNPVKYGQVPEAPVMEVVIPSVHEPGHAPPGQHLLSAIVQYAPHDPVDGHDAARVAMLAATMAQLERHAPGIGALVSHAEMLMPHDIQARWGMPGGNWHHGELSVEQMLFLRPLPELAQYRTPVQGLWLASAGCHPGGGISGAAGWNAAEAIGRAR